MKTFNARSKREKWFKMHFDSKSNMIKKLGLTRPTIDKLCKSETLFYKYLFILSKTTGCSASEIIEDLK